MDPTPIQAALWEEIAKIEHGSLTVIIQNGKITRIEPKPVLTVKELLEKNAEKALTNQAIRSKI